MAPTLSQLIASTEARRAAAERRAETLKGRVSLWTAALQSQDITETTRDQEARADETVRAWRAAQDEAKEAAAQLVAFRQAAQEERADIAASSVSYDTGVRPPSYDQVQRVGEPPRASVPAGPQFRRVSDGRTAAVEPGQAFRDNEIVREQIDATAERDRHITGLHGDFGQLVRSISTTSGAAALVPTMWAADIIDRARNAAVAFQAGATLVPMDAKLVQIARLTTDPAPAFRAEGNAIPATDPAFDYITLTATSLGTIVVASLELLQDAPNAGEVVQKALAEAMALEIDKAALFGQLGATGTNDEGAAYGLASPYPKGLLKNLVDNAAGQIVGAFPTNGTAQTAATPWNEMLAVYFKVARSNEKPGAIVSNTALVQQYAGMYDTLYNPIRMPETLASVPWLQTNAIPSYTRGTMTSRATDVFCGDWSQLLIGQRLELEIRTLTERYAELGQVGLLAFWRGDVQVARTSAFAVYRGLQGAV